MRLNPYYLLTLLLLPAMVGCPPFWQLAPPGPAQTPATANNQNVTAAGKTGNLQPGMECELEMVLPPTVVRGSYQRYVGKVAEVTEEYVLLSDATEEGWIEYTTSMKKSEFYRKPRGSVRVPLACIAKANAYARTAKADAPAKTAATPQPSKS